MLLLLRLLATLIPREDRGKTMPTGRMKTTPRLRGAYAGGAPGWRGFKKTQRSRGDLTHKAHTTIGAKAGVYTIPFAENVGDELAGSGTPMNTSLCWTTSHLMTNLALRAHRAHNPCFCLTNEDVPAAAAHPQPAQERQGG